MSKAIDLETLSFLDSEIQECPFPAYEELHKRSPVFLDKRAGFYVVTRYDDIRKIVADPARFSSAGTVEIARERMDPERAAAARCQFEADGWLPTPTLSVLDDPRHKELRAIFQQALRAGKIKELDPFIAETADRLVEGLSMDGRCEIVSRLCAPLPLIAICSQVGAPEADIWKIKNWTDSFIRRLSLMLSKEQEAESIRDEIAFQHYFAPIVDRLRKHPDGTIMSDLVNLRLSGGSQLDFAEIASYLMSDFFVAGSETTTNAISEGVLLLCLNPEPYALLQSNLDYYLPRFVEEVLRLQSPVQGLYRVSTQAVDIGGVNIPAGSLIMLRFAAANRDEQHFPSAAKLDLDRDNIGSHLTFGSGIHSCLGAPLARREMFWAFNALLRRCQNIRLAPNRNKLTHRPNVMLRSLEELHIEFDRS
jgi:cytochrome P450